MNTPPDLLPEVAALFAQRGHTPRVPVRPTAPSGNGVYHGDDDERVSRACLYLAKMPESVQGQNGSAALMAAARSVVWGFDLGVDLGADLLLGEFNPRCLPPWSEYDIRRACERAAEGGTNPRGWLLAESRERSPGHDPDHRTHYDLDRGLFRIPLSECRHLCELPGDDAPTSPASTPDAVPHTPGAPDLPPPPAGGPVVPSPPRPVLQPGVDEDDPQHLAALFLHTHRRSDGLTLRSWRNQWYIWEQGAYRTLPEDEVEDIAVQSAAAELNARHQSRADSPGVRQQEAAGADVQSRLPAKKKVTTTLTRNVLHNARGQAAVRSAVEPCWVDCDSPPAGTMIAFRNGVLDLSRHLPGDADGSDFMPPTPRYFTRNRLDFDFDPNPPPPSKWVAFLRQVWPDDRESIALLQQWFGYVISGDNSRQKFLAMIGAPNGGKGVICDILRGLAGQSATTSPTLHSLSGDFGLAALDGKSLAVIGDLRVSAKTDVGVAVERILNITGGGHSIVNAKNKAEREAKLTSRFVMASNGLPKLFDASAALTRRTLMLRFTISFADNPDTALADSLMTELPGIFAWAVDGLRSLNDRGKFIQPASGQELIDEFRGMLSNHSMFIADRCILDPEAWESFDDLYKDWKAWCDEEGKNDIGSKTTFKAKLREVVPTLLKSRPRAANPDRKEGYQGIRLRHLDELSEV